MRPEQAERRVPARERTERHTCGGKPGLLGDLGRSGLHRLSCWQAERLEGQMIRVSLGQACFGILAGFSAQDLIPGWASCGFGLGRSGFGLRVRVAGRSVG